MLAEDSALLWQCREEGPLLRVVPRDSPLVLGRKLLHPRAQGSCACPRELSGQQSLQSETLPRPSGLIIRVRDASGVCSIRTQDRSWEAAHLGPHCLPRLLKDPAHRDRLDEGPPAPLALGEGPDHRSQVREQAWGRIALRVQNIWEAGDHQLQGPDERGPGRVRVPSEPESPLADW